MNKGKRILGVILAVASVVSMASGCTSAEKTVSSGSPAAANTGKVTIRFATNWGPGDGKYNYFKPLLDQFIKENSDKANIVCETATTEDYKTKMKVDLASGNLPDVFTYWGGSLLGSMVKSGVLLNADDYFQASSSVKKNQFDSSSFGYYTIKGTTYGVPIEGTRSVFLVNKDLFKKYGLSYPKTYDDLKKDAAVFNKNGIIPIAMGSKNGTPAEFFFSELYNQYTNAEDELNSMGKTHKFATDNALKVATLLQTMVDDNMFPKDTVANGDWGPALQLYTSQKAAMTYTYPWMFANIPQNIQDLSDIISVPKMPGATNDPTMSVSGFTVYGFVINKASFEDPAKKDMVLKLSDFLASDELTKSLTKSGMIPAKKVDIDLSSASTIMKKLMDSVKNKKLTPVHDSMIDDMNTLNTLDSQLDELLVKSVTPQQFVDNVQKVYDKAK